MAAKEKVDKKLAKKIAEKKTPAGKLRDLSVAEIKTKIAELKQELFNLRFQAEVGKLENTAQLKKVKRLGPSAFVQCAGFMRIADGKNPLDNTGVLPESYDVCKKMIEMLGYTMDDIESKNIDDIDDRVKNIGLKEIS